MRNERQLIETTTTSVTDSRIPNGFAVKLHDIQALSDEFRKAYPGVRGLYLAVDRRVDGDKKWYAWSTTYAGAVLRARAQAAGLEWRTKADP